METNLEKTVTTTEFANDYQSDDINIHAELLEQFKTDNPSQTWKQASGELTDNGNDTLTYNITITH